MARRAVNAPRGASGQTAIEYAGLLAVLAIVFAAMVALGIPRQLEKAIAAAVCTLEDEQDCGSGSRDDDRTRLAKRHDPDADGLSTRQERRLGTSPRDDDSDGDGVPDGVEFKGKLDPRSRDTDEDGIEDARELALQDAKRVDPRQADTDGDGLLDGAELAAGTAAYNEDADRDGKGGLSDGLSDYDEIYRHGTDPTRLDTDGDGEGDGDEVRAGTNPLVDERSLGAKVGLGVTGFLLDDPSNLSPKGILKGLGKGLGAIGRKLGIGAGKQADEVISETAENLARARQRRQAATNATPNAARGTGPVAERGKLRKNLERVHGPLPDGYEAHHLVAVGHPRAAGARRILERYAVDPNSAVNGVALPGRRSGRVPGEPPHPSIHTNRYYEAIEARLAGAQSRRDVTQELGRIRRDVLAGTFP
jgi:hypothetical protein